MKCYLCKHLIKNKIITNTLVPRGLGEAHRPSTKFVRSNLPNLPLFRCMRYKMQTLCSLSLKIYQEALHSIFQTLSIHFLNWDIFQN